MRNEYERAYYSGIVCERRARSAFGRHMSGSAAYDWFHEAMKWYEKAEKIRPPGNTTRVEYLE